MHCKDTQSNAHRLYHNYPWQMVMYYYSEFYKLLIVGMYSAILTLGILLPALIASCIH